MPEDVLRSSTVSEFGYVYTVETGDDLWLIAISHDLNMEYLAEINDIDPPYWIHPGDKLWITAEPAPVHRPAPAPEPPVTSQPSPAAELPPVASEAPPEAALIISQMNQQRVAAGLPTLTWSPSLAQAAQAHAEDCALRGWGSHTGSDGAHLRTRLARAGYPANWAGENWANARNAQQAFDRWWYEPPGADPHRQNILAWGYTEVGIGIARGGWGYYFVADFGSR